MRKPPGGYSPLIFVKQSQLSIRKSIAPGLVKEVLPHLPFVGSHRKYPIIRNSKVTHRHPTLLQKFTVNSRNARTYQNPTTLATPYPGTEGVSHATRVLQATPLLADLTAPREPLQWPLAICRETPFCDISIEHDLAFALPSLMG